MLTKKYLFVGILTLLSLSLAIADPPAVHPVTGEPLVIECFRGTPDAIDGDLSDWNLWAMTPAVLDAAEQIAPDTANGPWDGPEDCSAEFYLLWDDVNVYIAVVVKDEKFSQNKTGGNIWNADCVEVFFSTLNAVAGDAEHYQYGFDATNQTWNWCNMDSAGQSAIDYLQVASTETEDGYICEAAIEHGQMLSLDWSVGNTIGFHPVIDDTDNGDREIQMTWTSFNAHDQSQGFGHMLLSGSTVIPGFTSNPSPANGALDEDRLVTLSWRAGEFAVSHDVYFGTVFDDVNNADTTDTTGVYRGSFDLDVTTYTPSEIPLEWGQTYYWRVDAVNDAEPDSPWKGDLWSFEVLNFPVVVEDFEDYNDYPPDEVWNTWIDGYGDPANGSTAGYPDPEFVYDEHYLEGSIVHGGDWSMPLFYDNAAGLSEVTRTLSGSVSDWTQVGVVTLTLFYYGDAANAAEPMYVAVNGNAVVANPDVNAALVTEWTPFDVPLQVFADQGVNLTNVGSISIGFGNKANPTAGGSGHVFFDDIRLYRP